MSTKVLVFDALRSETINTIRQKLWHQRKSADVTFVSEDGTEEMAHGFVLSSGSVFFKYVFQQTGFLNPRIPMKDVNHQLLKNILEFIYLGHCKILKKHVSDLFEKGKKYQISGLQNIESAKIQDVIDEKVQNVISTNEILINEFEANRNLYKAEDVSEKNNMNGKVNEDTSEIKEEVVEITDDVSKSNPNNKISLRADNKDMNSVNSTSYISDGNADFTAENKVQLKVTLDENNIKSDKETKVENITQKKEKNAKPDYQIGPSVQHHEKIYTCNSCESVFTRIGNRKAHIIQKHMGIKQVCSICSYQCVQKSHLKQHINAVHSQIRYPCNKCEYKAKYISNLNSHKQTHTPQSERKYVCNSCDYTATQHSNLKQHIESKHLSKKYICPQCNKCLSAEGVLKRHIKSHLISREERLIFKCKDCDFQASHQSNLRRHIKSIHLGTPRTIQKQCKTYLAEA